MSAISSEYHWDAFAPLPPERVKRFMDIWLNYLENDPAFRQTNMLFPRQSGKSLSPPAPGRVKLARLVRRAMGITEPLTANLPLAYITLGNENDVGYPGPFLVDSLHVGEESNRWDLLFNHVPFIVKEKKDV